MIKLPFIGGHYEHRNPEVSSQETINLMLEAAPGDTKGQGQSRYTMMGLPGTKLFTTIGSGPIRGMIPYENYLFVVSGNQVYRYDWKTDLLLDWASENPSGSQTTLTTSSGQVDMASSGLLGNQILLVDGDLMWCIYTKPADSSITDIVKSGSGGPTTITAPGHGLTTGDKVYISGVVDDAASADPFQELFNGLTHIVTVTDSDNFTVPIDTSAGAVDYASGGTVERERMFAPGTQTQDSADEAWTVFTSVDNDTYSGTQGATDAVAWTNPGNAAAEDASSATATIGLDNSGATNCGTGTWVLIHPFLADWSNASNITGAADDSYATAAFENDSADENSRRTDSLQATNYSFSIPTAAKVVGITATVERSAALSGTNPGSGSVDDYNIQLIDENGNRVGDNKKSGTPWPSSDTQITYGSSADLWGHTWTPANINDSNFGLDIQANITCTGKGSGTSIETAYVDNVSMTVYYTTATDFLECTDRDGSDLDTSNAIITGVEIDIKASCDTANTAKYQTVQLVINGTAVGNDKGSEGGVLTTTLTTKTFGGAADLWGLGNNILSASAINSENTGVRVSFEAAETATTTDAVNVDYVNLLLYYSTSGAFQSSEAEWMDSYFIINEVGTGRIYTDNGNGCQAWDTVNDFATVERDPDGTRAIIKQNRLLWLIGASGAEAWYDSGEDFPFSPVGNMYVEGGTPALKSVAKFSGGVVWLAQSDRGGGVIITADGNGITPISTPGMGWVFRNYTDWTEAYAWTFSEMGHEFYVITFPSDGATWAYDFTTQAWSRWESFNKNQHFAQCHVYWSTVDFDSRIGANLVGDTDGSIYALSALYTTEAGNKITRRRVGQHMHGELINEKLGRHMLKFAEFELDVHRGHAPVDDPGRNELDRQRIGLSWSDDSGRTWSPTRWRDIPAIGQNHRVRWQGLGSARDRIFMIETDTTLDFAFSDAYALVEVGDW